VLRQQVRDRRVICARDAAWKDVESCYSCSSFKRTYQHGRVQTIVCRPPLDQLQGAQLTDTALLRR
jgi:hypothetical protein